MTARGRPSRGVWVAWSMVFVGAIAVLGAALYALTDPCVELAEATRATGCVGRNPTLVMALALIGTTVAVIGGTIATILTLRRR